ncbi:MAG: alpha/beta fold hydrolase [Anaerolineae bacterium]|jgi:carboxylesterase
MKKRVLFGMLIVLSLALLLAAVVLFKPVSVGGLTSQPDPAVDYAEAVGRIEALQAREASLPLNPLCQLTFMTQGQKAEQAIAFLHGYTNCPQQFSELGQHFYDLGYNVLIVPAPHHGLVDRMTTDQARLTAEELAAYADHVVDIAQGLGEHVTLAGISMGGITTAWAAQHRSDLDLAVLISPAFGFQMIPRSITAPVVNAFLVLPNFYMWADSELKEESGTDYTYPRRSTRALAQTLRLGMAVQAQSADAAPAARSMLVVTNASDPSVDNGLTAEMVAVWREGGLDVETYEFAAELQLEHDLISPWQGTQAVVYPLLVDLVRGAAEGPGE